MISKRANQYQTHCFASVEWSVYGYELLGNHDTRSSSSVVLGVLSMAICHERLMVDEADCWHSNELSL